MNRPVEWRYVVIGVGFLGLAALRASQGAPGWAAVFAVAAAADFWLALREGARKAGVATAHAAAPPQRADVERSLTGYRTSARQWQVIAAAGVLLGGGLLLTVPPLAPFAGAAALFALYRARRAGRAVTTLRRAGLAQQ